jgi:sugar phosphate isomerase/epimerase
MSIYDTIYKGDGMIMEKMKKVIRFAIEQDIDYLETFLGYEGDDVLKITTKSQRAMDEIEAFLKQIGLKYKAEFNISEKHNPNYQLFVGVSDPSIFKLRRD